MARRKSRTNLNLDVLKFFFDPHPGFAGAAIPIPSKVKGAADRLNGRKTTLRKALTEISSVTNGIVFLRDGWIGLKLDDPEIDYRIHTFRVIRFR